MPPSEPEVLHYKAPRGLWLVGVGAAAIMAVVVVVGVLGRVRADQSLKTASADQSIATVELVAPKKEKGAVDLVLPGDVQALENAPVRARVSGYLKRWYPDIGARVAAGQLLAEVDTPELDQQLARARADVNTAAANQNLSKTTEARWKALLAQDAVSQQEYDEKAGDLAAKISVVAAAKANLAQLEATAAFKRVVAPFAGVVTQRSTDIGQLISATGATGDPLYTISDIRRLRIYVRVPQAYTPQIKAGMVVDLHAPEHPNEPFPATVVTDSHAIDPRSGTLLVQLQIDNGAGTLKPGQYVQAEFKLPASADVVTVPATTLIYRAAGPQVATLGADDKVRFRPVTVGRDLGSRVQLTSGVGPQDKVIDNPPDALSDGDRVHVAAAREAKRG